MYLTTIFYHADNFCNEFEKNIKEHTLGQIKKRGSQCSLSQSEIITIVIFFHHSKMRTFKDYYKSIIKCVLKQAFPKAPSYNRFVELMPQCLMAMYAFLTCNRLGKITGISFIDSTSIKVCHNLRISSYKVFKGFAKRGKTSTGWFYGFKLHIIINESGEVIAFDITQGNCDDRKEKTINKMTKNLWGKLFGDRGYISAKLFKNLYSKGITLFTRARKGMQNVLLGIQDKLLLRKRGMIESVNDILKNDCFIEHTRHRSPTNFFINLISGLIAYSFRDKKPSIKGHIANEISYKI